MHSNSQNTEQSSWSISNLGGNIRSSWLLLGDFNQVLTCDGNVGGSDTWEQRAGALWDIRDACSFLDISFSGPDFT